MKRSFSAPLRTACWVFSCLQLAAHSAAAQSTDASVPDAPSNDATPVFDETPPDIEETETPRSTTGITGRLLDRASQQPLIDAPVLVVGTNFRTSTDLDGNFSLALPAGTYTLRTYYSLHRPQRIENVVVHQGRHTRLDVQLEPTVATAALEVRVTGRAELSTAATQLQLRRESAAVQDALSAQEISRTPDSAASDAVRRVVGVSLLENSYAVIRGLSARYVHTLLNGVPLPSTDPDVPGTQLDLFPASLLTSLSVVKTFLPELPGDFAGGSLQLTTREFPQRFTLSAGASIGFDTLTHARGDGVLRYPGSPTDALGFDSGTRALPRSVPAQWINPSPGGLDRDAVASIARTFSTLWNIYRDTPIPAFSLSFNVGDSTRIAGRPFGYVLALTYGYNARRNIEQNRRLGTEGPAEARRVRERDAFTIESNTQSAQWGLLSTLSFSPAPDNDLSLTALWNQFATDYTAFRDGPSEDSGSLFRVRAQRYTQRSLFFTQLTGDHRTLRHRAVRLRWQTFASYGRRYEPDTRYLAYAFDDPTRPRASLGPGNVDRLFSDLQQLEGGGAFDLFFPIGPVTARIGALSRFTDRTFETRRFTYQQVQNSDPELTFQTPNELFAPENLGPRLEFRETTQPTDSYTANQQSVAPYLRAEVQLGRVRIVGGARLEYFRQALRAYSPFTAQATAQECVYQSDLGRRATCAERAEWNVLPALNTSIALTNSMNLRFAYGATVARPLLRELAPFLFPDFVRNRLIQGNPELRSTSIHNADARWEFFPGATDVFAVSAFGKYFVDPIEARQREANFLDYQNVQSAFLVGGELEARFSFARFHRALSAFSLNANLTLSYSRVSLSAEQRAFATNTERPLAGQAPFVANVALGFEPENTRFSAFVYYNVFAPRLDEVGFNGLPDVYQDTFHSLDAVVSWEPVRRLQLRLTARNLLHQSIALRQGDFLVQQQQPSSSFSLRVGYAL